jgi:hypothetical protein
VFLWALCRGDCRRAVVEVVNLGTASERERGDWAMAREAGFTAGGQKRVGDRSSRSPVCAARGFHGVWAASARIALSGLSPGCERNTRSPLRGAWACTLSPPTHSFVSPHFSFYFITQRAALARHRG